MEHPPPKRQKVLVACEPCRNRKAKCDGVGPVCGPCRRRARKTDVQCTWSASASALGIAPDMQRVAFLESRQQQSKTAGAPAPSSGPATTYPHARTDDPGQRAMEVGRTKAVQQEDQRSPVYTLIGPTERNENREGFFGSSSAGTFMQNVTALVEQRLRGTGSQGSHLLQPSENGRMESWFPKRQSSRVDTAEHSLPLRRTADELFQIYWQDVHTLFPILDHETTQEQYNRLWTGGDDALDQTSFLCLINAIFALASQLNPAVAPRDRAHVAARYYSRAMTLLDVWQTASLRTVQSLVLLAMYCQSSNEAHQCWILAGMSIRVSQALGIHLSTASERVQDVRTRELLRRVWHGCVQLDRTVSMTYGRPCGVGERLAVAVPLPSCETGDATDIPATTLEYYNLSTRLYRNLHEILYSLGCPGVIQVQSLEELYDRYFRHSPSDPSKPSVIDIEGGLQRWHDGIPDALKVERYQANLEESVLRRQAIILEQNYLHVRLLLLRPFLSAVIALDPDKRSVGTAPLSVGVSLQCAMTCVRVAQDSIRLIHWHRPQNIGATGSMAPWWFNVLFVYTAATVLNASLLSPPIVDELSEASILESWQLALAILEEHTVFGEHIRRLVITLRVLFDTMPKQYSHHRRMRSQREEGDSAQLNHAAPPTTSNIEVVPSAVPAQGQGLQPTLPSSIPFQASAPEQAFDWSQQTDNLWDLGFDPLDLTWLTSLPTDLAI